MLSRECVVFFLSNVNPRICLSHGQFSDTFVGVMNAGDDIARARPARKKNNKGRNSGVYTEIRLESSAIFHGSGP